MTRSSLVILLLVAACGGKIEPEVRAHSRPGGTGGKSASDAGEPSGQVDYSETCKGQLDLPDPLECTGLYADLGKKTLRAGVREYAPAVVLWSDGAEKHRYIQLPKGQKIDASDPNEWVFPVGTKLWKQFSVGQKRMETRYFVKLFAGSQGWSHATYAWNDDESAAQRFGGGDVVAPDGGVYHIPIAADCDQCHFGRKERILGFEQIGLGLVQPEIGLDGATGVTLADLVSEKLIDPPPEQTSLSIGDDGTGKAAPALAWMHMNCGVSCHNVNTSATAFGAGMFLRLDPTLLDGRAVNGFDPVMTTIGVKVHTAPLVGTRIVAGDPAQSVLWHLVTTRTSAGDPNTTQMPPIATRIVDKVDVKLITDWIAAMPRSAQADGDGG